MLRWYSGGWLNILGGNNDVHTDDTCGGLRKLRKKVPWCPTPRNSRQTTLKCSLVHLDVVKTAPLAASRRLIDLAGQVRHSEMEHDWLKRLVQVYLRAAIRRCREHGWGRWPDSPDLVCRRMPGGIILTSCWRRQSSAGGDGLDEGNVVTCCWTRAYTAIR
jgi:hypothetical protein